MRPRPDRPPPSSSSGSRIEWNPSASLRWLVMLLLVSVAIFFAIRYRRDLAAWVRDVIAMVRGWFASPESLSSEASETIREQASEPVRRFCELPDPFSVHAGDPDRTIQALFDAACVWGREHRVERREDETPEEFVARLGRKYSPVSDGWVRLGMVYSRLAYAQKRVQVADVEALRSLWEWMVQHPSRGGSSGGILGNA